MAVSKQWDWSQAEQAVWLSPSRESYYFAERWKQKGYQKLLDFGCGLGRHAIFFAKKGFQVEAFDLSQEGVSHLQKWSKKEHLPVSVQTADMLQLPYAEHSFDCVFAYHVISHTDTAGMQKIREELTRILKPGGEVFLTLCSKETWSFRDAGYPRLDENTVVKTAEGPEKGVPHFYVDLEDILKLFRNFELLDIQHTDACYFAGKKQNSRHYFILAKLPA